MLSTHHFAFPIVLRVNQIIAPGEHMTTPNILNQVSDYALMLREPQVRQVLGGISRSKLYRMWKKEKSFPPPRRIGKASVAWLRSEVESWIANRPVVS
jgi:predicted DNA-binding transcriptional regulator AlpA